MASLSGGTQTIAVRGVGTTHVTEGNINISVGVKGASFRIQYKLGGDTTYDFGDYNAEHVKNIALASEITVVNTGGTPVTYDIYAL